MSQASGVIELKSHVEIELSPGTEKSKIVEHLYQHDTQGFKPNYLTEALDMNYDTVRGTLRRLYKEGFIGQTDDGYYHALKSQDDIYRYVVALQEHHTMFHDADEQNPATGPTVGPEQILTDEDVDETLDTIFDSPDEDQ